MRLERKYVEMERDYAVRGTVEWIDGVIAAFERAMCESRGYRTQFLESVAEVNAGKAGATKPEEVVSWLVNATSAPGNNLRLDMAVTHGARLCEAFRKVKALAKQEAADAEGARPKTHMLTGVPTVLPTLRSARAYCDRVRAPTLIHVGTPESCFERAKQLNGGRLNCTIEEWHANHVPVVITPDWTYHVSSVIPFDDAEM